MEGWKVGRFKKLVVVGFGAEEGDFQSLPPEKD
jgi:hypothetical protein